MTEPDRIWINDKWEAYLRPTFDGDTSGYVRAALADPAAIREAALREAAARATERWAARREHADRLAEMDYPEAMIDAKTVSAKADEAEMIANEILALLTEKPHDRA